MEPPCGRVELTGGGRVDHRDGHLGEIHALPRRAGQPDAVLPDRDVGVVTDQERERVVAGADGDPIQPRVAHPGAIAPCLVDPALARDGPALIEAAPLLFDADLDLLEVLQEQHRGERQVQQLICQGAALVEVDGGSEREAEAGLIPLLPVAAPCGRVASQRSGEPHGRYSRGCRSAELLPQGFDVWSGVWLAELEPIGGRVGGGPVGDLQHRLEPQALVSDRRPPHALGVGLGAGSQLHTDQPRPRRSGAGRCWPSRARRR